MEILELERTTTGIKILLAELNSMLEMVEKSMNLKHVNKIYHHEEPRKKKIKEKWTETQGPKGQHLMA